jgi:hypothetical protein
VTPSDPPPPAEAESSSPSVRDLVAGPLDAGAWRAGHFAVPLSFSVEDDGWLVLEITDSELFFLRRADDPHVSVVFIAPRRMFSRDGRIVPLETPRQFVALLGENPELITGPVIRRTIAGLPAMGVAVTVRPEAQTDACGVPCVPLFPTPGFLLPRASKRERLFAIRHGSRVLVVSETRPADGSFARTRPVVDSIRLP